MKIDKKTLYISLSVIFLFVLFYNTYNRTQEPFWDEAYYLENVEILDQKGFTNDFLLNYKGPAGPTFALVHYITRPLTKDSIPGVRIVNIMLLMITMFVIFKIFILLGLTRANSILSTISMLAIPAVYTIAGLVLTEVPAVLFFSLFIYFLLDTYKSNKISIVNCIIGGLCLSMAILGRQPFLTVLIAIPILWFSFENNKINFKINKPFFYSSLIIIIISLVLPLYIFTVWGDIQPAIESHTGDGFAPHHLFLAFGYSCLFSLLINPLYFQKIKYFISIKEFFGISVFISVLNFLLIKVSFIPMKSIILNIVPENLISIYAYICGNILCICGTVFIYFLLKKNYKSKNTIKLFLTLCYLVIIGTSVKVTHQFSARYVVQAFPVLIILLNLEKIKINWINIVTLLIGGTMGIISLNSYYN